MRTRVEGREVASQTHLVPCSGMSKQAQVSGIVDVSAKTNIITTVVCLLVSPCRQFGWCNVTVSLEVDRPGFGVNSALGCGFGTPPHKGVGGSVDSSRELFFN